MSCKYIEQDHNQDIDIKETGALLPPSSLATANLFSISKNFIISESYKME